MTLGTVRERWERHRLVPMHSEYMRGQRDLWTLHRVHPRLSIPPSAPPVCIICGVEAATQQESAQRDYENATASVRGSSLGRHNNGGPPWGGALDSA